MPNLRIDRDRRVADVETAYDPERGVFNRLFATATPLFTSIDDGSGLPRVKRSPAERSSCATSSRTSSATTLGPGFYERNYDGSLQKEFLTTPLWGVARRLPYGHDGRSINLIEVILRHGGEAQGARDAFASLPDVPERSAIIAFLNTLVLFPPDDTASNLDPGNRHARGYPQFGHGSIRLRRCSTIRAIPSDDGARPRHGGQPFLVPGR